MLIDVVVPVRNGSAWIAQALNSVLNDASLLNHIIVIDDGSSDETAAIVQALPRQDRIELIRQSPLGVIAALNRGLHCATAPLVARMDADDISLPGRLQAQACFLAENCDVQVVGTQVSYIDEVGIELGGDTHYPTDPLSAAGALFAGRCILAHPSVTMRREAILALGGYRPVFEAAEDYDLWLRVAEVGKVANLAQKFLLYRRHGAQVGAIRKLRQSYSRDLALLCSLERRNGRPDPFAGVSVGTPYDPDAEEISRAPAIFSTLARGYRALAAMEGGGGSVRAADLSVLPELAGSHLLGEGRRTRRTALKKAFRVALSMGEWGTAVRSARMLATHSRKHAAWNEIRR